ncbi:MAG: hypothetical protein WA952_15210, partial [Lewinella sp.]
MTDNFSAYHITCSAEEGEIILALLADQGFDSFEETETGLSAYAATERNEEWIGVLNELASRI